MYYKKNDSIGIRKKGQGGQTVFSFGAGKNLGEPRLRGWADDVMKEMDNGMTPRKAKAWVNERLDE